MITDAVYILCAATALLCAALLGRSYLASRRRLLLWSTLCFGLLAINNVAVVVDFLVLPEVNLHLIRSAFGLTATSLLAFGLVWERG